MGSQRRFIPETSEASREPRLRPTIRMPGLALSEFYCPPGDPRWSTENRVVSGHLLVFPGACVRITHEGRRPFVTTPNHVMFYNAHQVYRRGLISERGDRCVFISIDPALVLDIVRELDPAVDDRPEQPFLFDHGPSDRRSYLLHHLIFEHMTTEPRADVLFAQERLFEIIRALVESAYRAHDGARLARRAGTIDAHRDAVEATKTLLSRRFREPILLEHLAREAHLSPYHLARLFKQHTGLTLHAYLNQLRLRSSLERVSSRGADLTELALDLGYSSHSHFTDAFRRAFRVPPSAVRRRATARGLREMSKILEV
jgi:AraC-like DNA-binding protein